MSLAKKCSTGFVTGALVLGVLGMVPVHANTPVYEENTERTLATSSKLHEVTNDSGYNYRHEYSITPTYADTLPGHEVWKIISKQFSNVFPISGMVDNPKPGQEVTLLGNNPIRILEVGDRHMKILSLEGHRLGPDNIVTLGISADGRTLVAEAHGPHDPGFPDSLIAWPTWNAFSNSIVHAVYESEPVGVIPSDIDAQHQTL